MDLEKPFSVHIYIAFLEALAPAFGALIILLSGTLLITLASADTNISSTISDVVIPETLETRHPRLRTTSGLQKTKKWLLPTLSKDV